jgi:hypothetical protein
MLRTLDTLGQYGENRPGNRDYVKSNFKHLCARFSALSMKASARLARETLSAIELFGEQNFEDVEVGKIVEKLKVLAEEELKAAVFLHIPTDADYYYRVANVFGDEVAQRFPSCDYDIHEAGKCLALERYTACVFHLMRCVELVLQVLAKSVNLPKKQYEDRGAQTIIDNIHKKLEADQKRRRQQKRSAKRTGDLAFYGQANMLLEGAKDAWRNDVAHGRAKFNREEADDIFQKVEKLMKHLATRLGEQP